MKVTVTPRAQEEIDPIFRLIAQDNPSRALSFTRELVGTAMGLTTAHARSPEVDPIRHPGIRRANHRGHRIFYRVAGEEIEVLHVLTLHAARPISRPDRLPWSVASL